MISFFIVVNCIQTSRKETLHLKWRILEKKVSLGKSKLKLTFVQKISFSTAKVLKRTGPYICDKCGLHFSTRDYISAHFRSQQCVVMFCDLCPQYFGRKTFLLNHMRSDHLGVRLFNCKLCNYRGSYKIGLRNHMLRHGSKTKCKICKKQVLHMRLHLKNHVKVECPICKKLRTKKNLRRHIEVHEKNKSK